MTWARRHRVAVAVGIVAAVVAAALVVAWVRRGPSEVSVEDVLQRERQATAPPTTAGPVARPAAGVYVYAADGVERLSLLSTEQRQGPTVPAVVRHEGDDCWVLRTEYSTNHWQEERYCVQGRLLLDMGGSGFQQFDFGAVKFGDTTTFVCDPPAEAVRFDAEPGTSWTQSCSGRTQGQGTAVTSAGTNTFVGREQVDIGGTPVDALHYRLERTITGQGSGTENTNHWYAVADGMLLRATHDARVVSPSPIGDVTYTETGDLRLTSTQPRT